MAKIKIKESEIQRVILDYLQVQENMGKLMFQRSNSLNVATKDGHYIKTGKKGSPDILVWAKFAKKISISVINPKKGYIMINQLQTIALEVKSETGEQTQLQKEWQNKFENIGGEYHIVRSLEDVMKILGE